MSQSICPPIYLSTSPSIYISVFHVSKYYPLPSACLPIASFISFYSACGSYLTTFSTTDSSPFLTTFRLGALATASHESYLYEHHIFLPHLICLLLCASMGEVKGKERKGPPFTAPEERSSDRRGCGASSGILWSECLRVFIFKRVGMYFKVYMFSSSQSYSPPFLSLSHKDFEDKRLGIRR